MCTYDDGVAVCDHMVCAIAGQRSHHGPLVDPTPPRRGRRTCNARHSTARRPA